MGLNKEVFVFHLKLRRLDINQEKIRRSFCNTVAHEIIRIQEQEIPSFRVMDGITRVVSIKDFCTSQGLNLSLAESKMISEEMYEILK
jgi:hypothetical protein